MTPEYVADLNDAETRFSTLDEVKSFLGRVEEQLVADLFVKRDLGPTGKLTRFLGGPKREVEPCFSLRKAGPYARLIFLDDAWSEYRAADPTERTHPNPVERAALSESKAEPVPLEECIYAGRAFAAVREFLAKSSRPDWLSYTYVK